MKKINKGHTGFTIGVVLYVLLSLIFLGTGIVMMINSSDAVDSYESQMEMFIGLGGIIIYLIITIWFVSFITAFRQRKTQIELLEELMAQGMGDRV